MWRCFCIPGVWSPLSRHLGLRPDPDRAEPIPAGMMPSRTMDPVESTRMKRSWPRLCRLILIPGLALLAAMAWSANPARAETLHLVSGEVIQGKIIRVDENSVSVESDKGYGVIQVNKADIILIEYDNKKRDPSRMLGVGYFHRTVPAAASPATNDYGLDALSLKYWISSTDSLDALLGFYSSSTDNTTNLQVFSMDLRYANVFQRKGMLDVYWGASVGFISVVDKTAAVPVNDTGTREGVFLGTEIFFVTLPNLGISAEVGFYTQSVGKRTVTDLSTSTFPTFAVRYYF
jgi:hypothetical protein